MRASPRIGVRAIRLMNPLSTSVAIPCPVFAIITIAPFAKAIVSAKLVKLVGREVRDIVGRLAESRRDDREQDEREEESPDATPPVSRSVREIERLASRRSCVVNETLSGRSRRRCVPLRRRRRDAPRCTVFPT